MKQTLWKQAKQFIDNLDVDEVIDFDINTVDYGDEVGVSVDVTVKKGEHEEPTINFGSDNEKFIEHIKANERFGNY